MFRCLAAILVFSCWCQSLNAQDWPALRGENGQGFSNTKNGILTRTSSVQLKTGWKKKLGSGYSSVVVSGDRLVTMYTDGTDDLVVCLRADNGETLWQTKTNPIFKGENGSFDGPLSTPVIHNQRVFVLTAVGRLICLTLSDGEELWSRDLPKETGAKRPLYGFVTSPIIVKVPKNKAPGGGLQIGSTATLVVQVGASKKQVFGFDLVSGKTVWAAGDDVISSQSPTLIDFNGETLLLAAGGKKLTGIDPSDGSVRFEHEHKGTNGQSVMPVPLGDNRILLTHDDRFSKAITLTSVSNASVDIEASELWQERTIKNTYNMPVLVGDGVFAYSTRILTCVDPATGKALWKTRSPGDGFLIAVDRHLVIATKTGSLHLAKANTEGFLEISKLSLFNDLVWSVPAYSDNALFVRSLGEIARVDLVSSETENATAESSDVPLGLRFKAMLSEVLRSKSKESQTQVVDRWFAEQKEFPVIEGDIAHFVYRGESSDVALAGDFFGARQEKKMIHLEGTDLSYYGVKLHPALRTNYCFLVDYQPMIDPRNRQRTAKSTLYAGEMEFALRLSDKEPLEMSWFGMPEWKHPEYLDEEKGILDKAGKSFGKLVERTIDAPESTDGKGLKVYLPPNYDPLADRKYPVVYMLDGASAQEAGDMVAACDGMFRANDKASAIVVFLEGRGPKFRKLLAEEIIPLVDKEFQTITTREGRLIVGCGFIGGEAMVVAALQNELFGNVSSQSPLVFAAEEEQILKEMMKVELPTKVQIQWGRWDIFNPHENWDVRTQSEKTAALLKKNENLTVVGGMVDDSTDWSAWKNRYEDIFGLFRVK